MATSDLERLRVHAVSQALFPPARLEVALGRASFVQADPIRAPARAQDLILRHRVRGYRAGDLERRYASLGLEEDVLYCYGFVTRETWCLLHPRKTRRPTRFEERVLEAVRGRGEVHPSQLAAGFGRVRGRNGWGGSSQVTTLALEELHWRGLVRVARREQGIRVYAPAPPFEEALDPEERARRLVLLLAAIFAPSPERSLRAVIAPVLRRIPANGGRVLAELVRTGALERRAIDGVYYVAPRWDLGGEPAPRIVRFLAPFDPLVWDRRRFEHLWGWAYRFEAYTPPAKRIRGYYAMPLLWGDSVIGWANAGVDRGRLDVEVGFVDGRPRERAFRVELDAEIARLEAFLGLPGA